MSDDQYKIVLRETLHTKFLCEIILEKMALKDAKGNIDEAEAILHEDLDRMSLRIDSVKEMYPFLF